MRANMKIATRIKKSLMVCCKTYTHRAV